MTHVPDKAVEPVPAGQIRLVVVVFGIVFNTAFLILGPALETFDLPSACVLDHQFEGNLRNIP